VKYIVDEFTCVTPVVYNQKIDMCKFKSSQKYESRTKQAVPSEACHEVKACFIILHNINNIVLKLRE